MPRCPYCNKEIGYLENIQECIVTWEFYLDKDGNPCYSLSPIDIEPTDDLNEWDCPHCGRIIAYDEEEAACFLKGGKND